MNSANKIFAEISVGELLDKISILEIKQKNIKDEQKIKIISKELESLNYSLKKDVDITDEINGNERPSPTPAPQIIAPINKTSNRNL